jgi:S1/P1 Nuclease
MKRLAIAVFALCVLFTAPASAWFGFGHMEVAAIAWGKLTPAAKATATRLLMKNPLYATWVKDIPEQDQERRAKIAFITAATWPDAIKKKELHYISDGPNGGNRPPPGPKASQNIGYADPLMHKYWHYIDNPFSPDGTRTHPPDSPNAQTQIAAFRTKLADSTASDDIRSYDLAWLLHLVGDVHQPLHATSRFTHAFRQGDNGGNLVTVDCSTVCEQNELHAFWDGVLGTSEDPQEAASAAALLPAVDAQLASIADEKLWTAESFQAAKQSVYVPPIDVGAPPYTITESYRTAALDLAQQRVALAGARLANLLNEALK